MNKYEKRSIESYNKKADVYDNTFDGKFTYKYKEKLLETVVLPQGGKLLDIACGNGRLLQRLSQKYLFEGYGVDISKEMVRNAKRINPTMSFEHAPCDALPFENNFFDAATVSVAFHHFPDVEKFSKEALRVLKPGGVLYIAEVYYSAIIRLLANPFIKFSKAGDVKFYGPNEIKRLLEGSGFSNEIFICEGNIQIHGARKIE